MDNLLDYLKGFFLMCHEHNIAWQWYVDQMDMNYHILLKYAGYGIHFHINPVMDLEEIQKILKEM